MSGKHVRTPLMLGAGELDWSTSVRFGRAREPHRDWIIWALCRTLMAEPWLGEGIGQLSIIATSMLSSCQLLFLQCMEYS